MMMEQEIHPEQFVTAVTPLLEKRDLCGLLSLLKQRWTAEQIVGLLRSRHCDARKVAALSLGLVGGSCCIPPLADQLKDADPMVNEMAEHALWSIWFRGGNDEANAELQKGARAMDDRKLECAIKHLSRAIEISPQFAEAYNQRAIAYYLLEQFDRSIEDCRQVVRLMPCHFGAWAGMGHCHAHEGHLAEALMCYRKALSLNPHLGCLRETVEEIERQLAEE